MEQNRLLLIVIVKNSAWRQQCLLNVEFPLQLSFLRCGQQLFTTFVILSSFLVILMLLALYAFYLHYISCISICASYLLEVQKIQSNHFPSLKCWKIVKKKIVFHADMSTCACTCNGLLLLCISDSHPP